MESFDASVAGAGASDVKPATSPVGSRNSSGLSAAGASEFRPEGAARTAVCSGESSVYSSSRRACDCVFVLFWDIVGLTFVRGGGGGAPPAGSAAFDRAFAATGRFSEVFSKLRAGYVALGGGADGAPPLAPFCGAG